MTARGHSTLDRRVQKTQRSLHEALISLIAEKDYGAITVQEILDRANVGRSTFYTHFGDKDELLVSGIHEMVRSVGASRRAGAASRHELLTWFSLPILEHHDRHRRTARMGAEARTVLHERLRRVLAGLIADDLRSSRRRPANAATQLPPELFAEYVASTFILLLNWWLETNSRLAPADVDVMFRSLVMPTLAAS